MFKKWEMRVYFDISDADRDLGVDTTNDMPLTADAVSLINAVCSGRSIDFTCEFMTCVPDILKKVRELGWMDSGEPPIVADGEKVEVVAAVSELMQGKDFIVLNEAPKVTTGVFYANNCKICFDGFLVPITGWVLFEIGRAPRVLSDVTVKGWQPLPVW